MAHLYIGLSRSKTRKKPEQGLPVDLACSVFRGFGSLLLEERIRGIGQNKARFETRERRGRNRKNITNEEGAWKIIGQGKTYREGLWHEGYICGETRTVVKCL